MKKRILSLLLCISLLGGSVPAAYAAEEIREETTVEVCDACGEEECICCESCGGIGAHEDGCALAPVALNLCLLCGEDPCVCEPAAEFCAVCGLAECVCCTICKACPCVCVSVYEELMAAESLEELYDLLYVSSYIDDLGELSAAELTALDEYADALYDPAVDDAACYEMVKDGIGSYLGTYENDAETLVSGDVGATTISSNTEWTLTGDVTLAGTITIKNGATLKIYGGSTIKRDSSFTGDMFLVENGGTLHINGSDWNNGTWSSGSVVLDGNADVAATGQIIDCSGKLSLRDTVIRNNKGYNAVWLGGSGEGTAVDDYHHTTIEITRVLIEKCSADSSSAGIHVAGSTPAGYTIEIWNSKIDQCTAIDASAMYLQGVGQAEITMKTSVVEDCDTTTGGSGQYGGAIRTNGNGRYKLTMTDSIVRNCDSWKFGGGIYWNASGTGSLLTITDCQFLNNTAAEMGGGMFLEGSSVTINASSGTPSAAVTSGLPGDIVGTLIQGNHAPNGGGISYKCYSNSNAIQIPTTEVNFGQNVIFNNNTGTNGAALAYNMHDTRNYPTNAAFTFNIDGAQFTNNTCTNGTGSAIYVYKCRDDYVCTVNFHSGTITNNTAKNGGAIAITTASGITVGGNFYMKGGTLSGNTATAHGGALYLQNGSFHMSGGMISGNTAADNGGAAYISGGSFTMSGGTLGGGAAAEANTATNGGAVYVTGGSVTVNDGTISGNAATASGGAAYVTNGSGESSAFIMKNGTVTRNSSATDGGAVYISGGSFTMTSGILSYNTTPGNGGAVYVTGGDFTMTSGTMENNGTKKDAGGNAVTETQYGGAVYADGGTITIGRENCPGKNAEGTGDLTEHTAHNESGHPIVQKNEAVFGGGLAVNNGTIAIHCCEIVENTAGGGQGAGMNIFMDGGSVVQNYDATEIGTQADPGIVSIGGQLTIKSEMATVNVRISYDPNGASTTVDWTGTAPTGYRLNLPYKHSSWSMEGATFVGWTKNQRLSAEDTKDGTAVRRRTDYLEIGQPITLAGDNLVEDSEGKQSITFYAVWAPNTNHISYAYHVQGRTDDEGNTDNTIVPGAEHFTNAASFPATYQFDVQKTLIPGQTQPQMPGYTFRGWRLYAGRDTISNWDSDPVYGEKEDPETTTVTMAHLTEAAAYAPGEPITTNLSFGNITLVALFTENTTKIQYQIVGPEGCGSVTPATEAVLDHTGSFSSAQAEVSKDSFRIVGWFKDAACTIPVAVSGSDADGTVLNADNGLPHVTSSTFTPIKEDNELWSDRGVYDAAEKTHVVTYYVKFAYAVADLVISTENMPADQSFIFTVAIRDESGKSDNGQKFTPVKVALVGNSSVTIKDVPVGTYIVTEESGWTWRYTVNGDSGMEVIVDGDTTRTVADRPYPAEMVNDVPTHTVTFTGWDWSESPNGKLWLSGLSSSGYQADAALPPAAAAVVNAVKKLFKK